MEDLSYWISSFRNESWYFRIWALFWLICFIVFCIGFGLLSARSAIAAVGPFFNNFFEYIHSKKLLFFLWQIRGEQVTFVTQLNSMTFPRCHFSTISPMTFLSHNCTYQNSPIPIENCPGSNDLTLCFTYVLCIAHTCVFISMSLSRVSFSLSSFHLYRSQVFLFYFFLFSCFVCSVRGDMVTAHPGTNFTDALSARSILCRIQTSNITGPHDDLISMSLENAQAFGWNACK